MKCHVVGKDNSAVNKYRIIILFKSLPDESVGNFDVTHVCFYTIGRMQMLRNDNHRSIDVYDKKVTISDDRGGKNVECLDDATKCHI